MDAAARRRRRRAAASSESSSSSSSSDHQHDEARDDSLFPDHDGPPAFSLGGAVSLDELAPSLQFDARKHVASDTEIFVTPRWSLRGGWLPSLTFGLVWSLSPTARVSAAANFSARRGLSLDLALRMGRSNYRLPLRIAPSISAAALFVGVALPFGLLALGRWAHARWTRRAAAAQLLADSNEAGRALLAAHERAEQQQRMLRPLAARSVAVESVLVDGLVIVSAWFELVSSGDAHEDAQAQAEDGAAPTYPTRLCVRVPLQAAVRASRLALPAGADWTQLIGWADIADDTAPKRLRVRYAIGGARPVVADFAPGDAVELPPPPPQRSL